MKRPMPSKLLVVVALMGFNLLLACVETALVWPQQKSGLINIALLGFLLYGVLRGNESIRRLLIALSWIGLVFAGIGLVLTIPLFTTLLGSMLGILTIVGLVVGSARAVYLIWCLNQPDVQRWMFERSLDLTRETGPQDDSHKAVNSERLGAMQRTRKRVVVGVTAILACGVLYLLAREPIAEHFEKKEREARYAAEEARYREAAEKRRAEQSAAIPSSTFRDPPNRLEKSSAAMFDLPPEKSPDEVALLLQNASDKRLVMRDEVVRVADAVYGAGFRPALKQIGKVPDDKHEMAILPALAMEVRGSGCGDALDEAKAAPKARASVFASKCPPAAEPRAIAPKSLKDVPLWAATLSVLLELRARDRKVEKDPLHREIIAALLAERGL